MRSESWVEVRLSSQDYRGEGKNSSLGKVIMTLLPNRPALYSFQNKLVFLKLHAVPGKPWGQGLLLSSHTPRGQTREGARAGSRPSLVGVEVRAGPGSGTDIQGRTRRTENGLPARDPGLPASPTFLALPPCGWRKVISSRVRMILLGPETIWM